MEPGQRGVKLTPGTGTRCFVAGFTDLVTDEAQRETPFCVDTDEEALPAPETEVVTPAAYRDCVGPWIPEEPAVDPDPRGCRLSGDGSPGGLVLLALFLGVRWRRRGREGTLRTLGRE